MMGYNSPRTARSSFSAKYPMFLLFSPAIDIRPFSVRYTCAFSVSARLCSCVSPVKLNIPIWSTICPHVPGVCSSSVSSLNNSFRISIIRNAIVFTSRFHSSNNAPSFRIADICHFHFNIYISLIIHERDSLCVLRTLEGC